ncbi:MAG: SRPBCC family protein [Nitrososphaerales archaeon]
MTFEISLVMRKINADKEFVFDWWTDLSPEDATLVTPLKSRQIISKTPNLILLRDEEEMYFRRMSFDVKVTLERPERWISEYDGKQARARSEYVLTSESDGTTTLSYRSTIKPKGLFTKVFSPLVKVFVKRVFAGEMKTFVSALEADYRTSKDKVR